MKVLKSLSFIKKSVPITDTNAEFWKNLNQASQEVRLPKQGNLKLKTAQEFCISDNIFSTNLFDKEIKRLVRNFLFFLNF